jgi:hypothetical protein
MPDDSGIPAKHEKPPVTDQDSPVVPEQGSPAVDMDQGSPVVPESAKPEDASADNPPVAGTGVQGDEHAHQLRVLLQRPDHMPGIG